MTKPNMIHYATIVIKVEADEKEVNGPNEIVLSDAMQELAEAVEDFLVTCKVLHNRFYQLEFSVDTE